VSPILWGIDGMSSVFEAMAALKPLRPSVNTSTGMHVHVSTCARQWPYTCTCVHALSNIVQRGSVWQALMSEGYMCGYCARTVAHKLTSTNHSARMLACTSISVHGY
jgi:hypothetical protein